MSAAPVRLRPMTMADLPQVLAIERRSFSLPWSEGSFRSDLTTNPSARLLVAERGGQVVGYVGLWQVLDQAHISTLAVAPETRRQGIGAGLLQAGMRIAADNGASEMTLEVRASNQTAQRLYHRFGFEVVGRRRRYYKDNLEDAVLMTLRRLPERLASQAGEMGIGS